MDPRQDVTTKPPTLEGEGSTSDHLNLIPHYEEAQTPSPGCAGCLPHTSLHGGGGESGAGGEGGGGGGAAAVAGTKTGGDVMKTSVWNCDGETIHDAAVFVKMHRKVCFFLSFFLPYSFQLWVFDRIFFRFDFVSGDSHVWFRDPGSARLGGCDARLRGVAIGLLRFLFALIKTISSLLIQLLSPVCFQ